MRSIRCSATKSSADRLGRGWISDLLAVEKRVLPSRGGGHRAGRAGQRGGGWEKGVPAGQVSVIYPGIDLGRI